MRIKSLIIIILCMFCLSGPVRAEGQRIELGYPVVDEIETKVLGTAYPQDDIYRRLDRLEMTVYGRITNAPLNERVEMLQNGSKGSSQIIKNASGTGDERSIILYDLEKQLLGTVYITDPPEVRVARLEHKVFSQSSANYPIEERLQRLCAYADARDSGDYYEDRAKMNKYNQLVNGARVISVLFMILQMFL